MREKTSNHKIFWSNLSQHDCSGLFVREKELKKIFEFLSPDYRQHIIVVNGAGGIGKTSLALQAACFCHKRHHQIPQELKESSIPEFTAVIFLSLKNISFGIKNNLLRAYKNLGLQYIIRNIANTSEKYQNKQSKKLILSTDGERQIKETYKCLSRQPTLLIIDNLESVSSGERENILVFLSNLPNSVKSIITTRNKVDFYSSIYLNPLSEEEGLELIKKQKKIKSKIKNIFLDDQESREIFKRVGGVPLALVLALGRIHREKHTEEPSNLKKYLNFDSIEDKTYESFKKSFALLSPSERKVLICLSFFPDFPQEETIAIVAGDSIGLEEIKKIIKQLELLSLINYGNEGNKIRHSIHPVIYQYLERELVQDLDFAKDARARWTQWAVDFADYNGGQDWEDYKHKYQKLDAEWNNLLAVLDWCAIKSHYDRVKELWVQVNQFSHLQYYWQDRLFWLNWLIEESQKREEWSTTIFSMSEKAFTLIKIAHESDDKSLFEDARSLLEDAHELVGTFAQSASNEDLNNQTLVCQHFALLYLDQGHYIEAYKWLDNESNCVYPMQFIEGKNPQNLRRSIAIDTLKAEICFQQENYLESLKIYQEIAEQSQAIKWKRREEEAISKISEIREKMSAQQKYMLHKY